MTVQATDGYHGRLRGGIVVKTETLTSLAPLLGYLRAQSCLREVRPAAFHLNGRDFIHFHELDDDVVADVRLSSGRLRLPVSTTAQQAELLDRLEPTLTSLSRGERS
jgi:hypothetical protein